MDISNYVLACGFGDGVEENLLCLDGFSITFSTLFEKCGYLCIVSNDLILGAKEDESGNSEVCLFRLTQDGFTICDRCFVTIGSLCHISFNYEASLVLGACYLGGVVFSIPLSIENAKFTGKIEFIYQEFEEQVSRAHFINTLKDGKTILSVNIELSRLYLYTTSSSRLVPNGHILLPSGVGPRHFCEGADGNIYIITEYSNEILRVKDNKLLKRYSTLAVDFSEESYGGSIAITKDNKRIYASNRGENSVVMFNVAKDGSLALGGRFSVKEWPRHIALIENDSILAVAAQRDNSLTFYGLAAEGLSSGVKAEISLAGACFVL